MTNKNTPFQSLELQVGGMSCAGCVSSVEAAVQKLPGVKSAHVNLALEKISVRYQPQILSEEAVSQAITAAGYTPSRPPRRISKSEKDADTPTDSPFWKQEELALLLAAALSLPLVLPMVLAPFGTQLHLSAETQLLLAAPVQFGLGLRFYRSSWTALRNRAANMDVLVAMGTTAAFLLSVYEGFLAPPSSGLPHLYFESSAMIITFVRLGKWLENKAKKSAAESLRSLQKLQPTVVSVERNDEIKEVSPEEVRVGETLLVKPGERVGLDAIVVQGRGEVDESLVTGESLPRVVTTGDSVAGGAINGNGLLRLKTTALAGESTLARIARLVENAQSKKAPIQKLVDRISAVFVPVVVILACITALGWFLAAGQLETALLNAVAVLVIACPCALGLATPTSLLVGTGLAARAGILIKDAEVLEQTRRTQVVVFDKTGTLTEGRPTVSAFITNKRDPAMPNKETLLCWMATVQEGSSHPLAQAAVSYTKSHGAQALKAQKHNNFPGRGTVALLEDHQALAMGNRELLKEWKVHTVPFPEEESLRLQGLSLSYLISGKPPAELKGSGTPREPPPFHTWNWQVCALVSFADTTRDSAKGAVAALRGQGIHTVLLTGDHSAAAQSVSQETGIDECHSGLLPEGKNAAVESFKQGSRIVTMVGDGINDAPALAHADVGMAMATGTNVAMQAAGVTLMRPNLFLVVDAIEISRKTSQKIRQNLFWAFAYNTVGIPLAASGLLSPMIAGGAMALSSVCVVTNALLLRRWQAQSHGLVVPLKDI